MTDDIRYVALAELPVDLEGGAICHAGRIVRRFVKRAGVKLTVGMGATGP